MKVFLLVNDEFFLKKFPIDELNINFLIETYNLGNVLHVK